MKSKIIQVTLQVEDNSDYQSHLTELRINLKNDNVEIIIPEDEAAFYSGHAGIIQFLIDFSQHPISSGIIVLFVDKLISWLRKNKDKKSLQINIENKIFISNNLTESQIEELKNKIVNDLKKNLTE